MQVSFMEVWIRVSDDMSGAKSKMYFLESVKTDCGLSWIDLQMQVE